MATVLLACATLTQGCALYAGPDLPLDKVATIQGEKNANGNKSDTIAIDKIDGVSVHPAGSHGLGRYKIRPGSHTITATFFNAVHTGNIELPLVAEAGKAYVVHGGTQGYFQFRAWTQKFPQPGPDIPDRN